MSQYYNNQSTKEWMGNYKSGNIGISIPYQDFSIGIRFFKMASVHPKKELMFNNSPLPKTKILNPVKVDYFASYSINFKPNISIEPFLGVTGNYFHVINQDDPSATYSLSRVFGLNSGFVVNKYFRIREFEFVSAFAGLNYSTTNFNKIHPSLGRGYAEWNIGIAYKGFGKSLYYKRVD